ncbi:MAG: flagellar biosynthesis anti-sigma factor FlgM [Acidobacteriota bacterium]|nr:flagellar biosynthesis anti-sigma factor FlgM [Acidobacteriota bacterium]
MRIDDYNVSANGAASRTGAVETTAVQLNGSKAQQTAEAAGAGDSVELSGLSRIFQASDNQRADRIRSLSALVRDGGYSVDAQTVSRALILDTLAGGGSELHA